MRLVVKFGGTSVKTTRRLQQAARHLSHLAAEGHQLLAVVSAMGDETDRLLRRGRELYPESPFDQNLLRLLSSGEARTAALMTMALRGCGGRAQAVDFSHPQFPLVAAPGQAQGQHLSAAKVNDPVEVRLDEDECARRFASLIEPMLAAGTVTVLPGFFVKEPEGALVSLGRGGSDVSAFLAGKFCRADEVIIVTDVPGVLSADPRLVEGVRLLPVLDAGQLAAMARSGVQVLHPNALRHKPESLVARVVHYRSLGRLRRAVGTRIEGAANTSLDLWPQALEQVLLFGQNLAGETGILGRLGVFLAERKISVHSLTGSDRTVALYLEDGARPGLLQELHAAFVGPQKIFSEVVRQAPICELTLLNPAFVDTPGVIAAVSQVLGRSGINIVEMVTSHAAIVIYCRFEDGARAAELVREKLRLGANS